MAGIVNKILETLFKIILIPFMHLHPIWGLLFISVIAAILMLLIFKKTSNQSLIKQTRKKISGHILGIRFYRDDQTLIFNAVGNIFKTNLIYLKHFIGPFLILLIPLGLIMIHTALYYQYRPLHSDEECILTVKLVDKSNHNVFEEIRLIPSDEIIKETPPLRILSDGEVYWRLRTGREGIHPVNLLIGEEVVTYAISVNNQPQIKPIQPMMLKNSLAQLLHPGRPAIPSNHPIRSISVSYPDADLSIGGFQFHWLVGFILFSVLAAFLMKGLFRIEF